MTERSYAIEESEAWHYAMHLLSDKLSLTRGYSYRDIPSADYREIEAAFQEWAVANVRARMVMSPAVHSSGQSS